MISFTQMQDAIYDWINGQTGVECIWQFQNAVVPDKKYFALRLMSFTQIHDAVDSPSVVQTDAGERDLTTTFDFVLEILGFGFGIMEDTVNLKNSLNRNDVHQALRDDGNIISWNDTNAVQDISGLDGHENEERSSWDVDMRTADEILDIPAGAIDILDSTGAYKQSSKSDITRNVIVDINT